MGECSGTPESDRGCHDAQPTAPIQLDSRGLHAFPPRLLLTIPVEQVVFREDIVADVQIPDHLDDPLGCSNFSGNGGKRVFAGNWRVVLRCKREPSFPQSSLEGYGLDTSSWGVRGSCRYWLSGCGPPRRRSGRRSASAGISPAWGSPCGPPGRSRSTRTRSWRS